MTFNLKKLDLFPTQPGVYIMKDAEGETLYIGKAKNLRIRVKQYFVPGRDGRIMIPFLVAKVHEIDTIVVNSEKEALLLENNLIKQHKPRYNALLKDDKTYIALKISTKKEWPTVELVRYRGSPDPDGLYFGPYTSAQAARQTIELLNRLFPLRQCSDQEMARRVRPCLLFQMKRCVGPCCGECTKDEYNTHLQRTIKFLRGQDKEVLKELHEEMERLSDSLEFEKAAAIHRAIQYIEKTIEVQVVDRPLGVDADALGIYRQGDEVVLSQLLFRGGRLVGSAHFNFNNIIEEDKELLSTFLMQHYSGKEDVPTEILLPTEVADVQAIEEIFSTQQKRKITIGTPQRGAKKSWLDLAFTNAEATFKKEKDAAAIREKTLLELKESLNLQNFPHRIECIDNSNIAGTEPVSALVAFTGGEKDKKRYRTYGLKYEGKPDDYAAMHEVLFRRYKRAKEEDDLPDLVIVDGGKGQLNMALRVFEELNIVGVDIIGLAKENSRHDKGMTSEQIFLSNKSEPIFLKNTSPLLFFLQNIRDEAHRAVLHFHRKRRSKKLVQSSLVSISGIGPAKCKALLQHFGSLKKIEAASDEELKQVKGINNKNILALRAFFSANK